MRIQVHELSREERLLELHAPPLELQDIGNVTDLKAEVGEVVGSVLKLGCFSGISTGESSQDV